MKSSAKIKNSKIVTPLIFLFFFSLMLSSSGGPHDIGDGKGYFLLTENLVKHHSLILYPDLIPPFGNNPDFSIRNYFSWLHALRHNGQPLASNATLEPTPSLGSPLFALVGVPFYVIGNIFNHSPVKFTYYFVNSLILSLVCTVVFAFGSELYRSKKIGFVISLVAGIGSFAWTDLGTYLDRPITALVSISCLYFLYMASKNTVEVSVGGHTNNVQHNKFAKTFPAIAGLFLGLQSFTNPGTIIVVPGIAVIALYLLRKDKAKLIMFFVVLILLVVLQGGINLIKSGSITEFGYGFAQTGIYGYLQSVEGLYGLVMSPGFGLLTYFPLIALLPLGVYFLWKQNKLFCIAFLYVFLSIWIFYGTLPGVLWIGLGTWGPRYMITTIPVLALIAGSVLQAASSRSNDFTIARTNKGKIITLPSYFRNFLKTLFAFLAVSGFLANLLGVLVWYPLGFGYAYGVLHVNILTPQGALNYQPFTWDVKYSPVLTHWKVLTTDWWKSIRDRGMLYGWSPCMPDNFLYCNFGILPSVAAFLVTAVLGFMLTNAIFENKIYRVLKTRKYYWYHF